MNPYAKRVQSRLSRVGIKKKLSSIRAIYYQVIKSEGEPSKEELNEVFETIVRLEQEEEAMAQAEMNGWKYDEASDSMIAPYEHKEAQPIAVNTGNSVSYVEDLEHDATQSPIAVLKQHVETEKVVLVDVDQTVEITEARESDSNQDQLQPDNDLQQTANCSISQSVTEPVSQLIITELFSEMEEDHLTPQEPNQTPPITMPNGTNTSLNPDTSSISGTPPPIGDQSLAIPQEEMKGMVENKAHSMGLQLVESQVELIASQIDTAGMSFSQTLAEIEQALIGYIQYQGSQEVNAVDSMVERVTCEIAEKNDLVNQHLTTRINGFTEQMKELEKEQKKTTRTILERLRVGVKT